MAPSPRADDQAGDLDTGLAATVPSAATGDRLGTHLKLTERLLISVKARALEPYGLTVAQYAALHSVRELDNPSAAAVARACAVTPQTIGAILHHLAERALITRSPAAAHSGVVLSRLTPEGAALLDQADAATLAIESELDAMFSTAQRAALVEGLARLRTSLRRSAAQLSRGHRDADPRPA